MKSYKEVANSVLERGGAIIEQKNRRRKTFARVSSIVIPCTLVALLATIMIGNGILSKTNPPTVTPSTPLVSDVIESPNTDIISDNVYVTNDIENNNSSNKETQNNATVEYFDSVEPICENDAYSVWHDKAVFVGMKEQFEAANGDDVFGISAHGGSSNIDNLDFIYKGKTLKEHSSYASNFGQEYTKLSRLLKVGDELKYGETLYTTGTQDGIKWHKLYYEETMEYYGEEWLSQYIVDGEFLREKVITDQNTQDSLYKEAYDWYLEAKNAYRDHHMQAAVDHLLEMGISVKVYGNTWAYFEISVDDFAALEFEDMSNWHFYPAETLLKHAYYDSESNFTVIV